jgi:hypothetical protein
MHQSLCAKPTPGYGYGGNRLALALREIVRDSRRPRLFGGGPRTINEARNEQKRMLETVIVL